MEWAPGSGRVAVYYLIFYILSSAYLFQKKGSLAPNSTESGFPCRLHSPWHTLSIWIPTTSDETLQLPSRPVAGLVYQTCAVDNLVRQLADSKLGCPAISKTSSPFKLLLHSPFTKNIIIASFNHVLSSAAASHPS